MRGARQSRTPRPLGPARSGPSSVALPEQVRRQPDNRSANTRQKNRYRQAASAAGYEFHAFSPGGLTPGRMSTAVLRYEHCSRSASVDVRSAVPNPGCVRRRVSRRGRPHYSPPQPTHLDSLGAATLVAGHQLSAARSARSWSAARCAGGEGSVFGTRAPPRLGDSPPRSRSSSSVAGGGRIGPSHREPTVSSARVNHAAFHRPARRQNAVDRPPSVGVT